jgi:hypothetical protein
MGLGCAYRSVFSAYLGNGDQEINFDGTQFTVPIADFAFAGVKKGVKDRQVFPPMELKCRRRSATRRNPLSGAKWVPPV